jgi:hypothetical protein
MYKWASTKQQNGDTNAERYKFIIRNIHFYNSFPSIEKKYNSAIIIHVMTSA